MIQTTQQSDCHSIDVTDLWIMLWYSKIECASEARGRSSATAHRKGTMLQLCGCRRQIEPTAFRAMGLVPSTYSDKWSGSYGERILIYGSFSIRFTAASSWRYKTPDFCLLTRNGSASWSKSCRVERER
jgi:hypothetical protein